MEIEYTLEDAHGDTISFAITDGSDLVEVSIPFNEETMSFGLAVVVLDKQDIARLAEKLGYL